MAADELFKRYKGAVGKISVRHHGVAIAEGAGFFISSDGRFVTSQHLLRYTLLSAAFDAEIQLADGTVVRSFRVAGCGDKRHLDLCLLKLDVTPAANFTLTERKPLPGEAAFVIGHPRGLDFSISNGIVSALRSTPAGIEEVQISTAISPGTSGGPIFNDRGELLGIVSRFMSGGQSLNFGVATGEITNYAAFNKDFISLAGARQKIAAQTEKFMKDQAALEVDPAINLVTKGQSLDGTPGFREMNFDFGNERMSAFVPASVEGCSRTQSSPTSVIYACGGWGDAIVFSVQRMPMPGKEPLRAMNNKRLVDPKSLAIVDILTQDGTWQDLEEKLSREQRSAFNSRPSLAQCQPLRPTELTNAAFKGDVTACRFSVENATEAESRSESVWVEKNGMLYSFNMWIRDPGYIHYFKNIPTIAVLSAKTNSPAGDSPRSVASVAVTRPGSNYEINLGPSMDFISGKKTDESVTDRYALHDLYAKKDAFRTFTVRFLRRAINVGHYVNVARELFDEQAASDGIKVKRDSVDPGTMDYKGQSLQLITAFGTLNGREVMLLHAVIFGPGDTFVLSQVSDVSDPVQSFGDFKKVLGGFKRK